MVDKNSRAVATRKRGWTLPALVFLAVAAAGLFSLHVYLKGGSLLSFVRTTDIGDLKGLQKGSRVRLRGTVTYYEFGSQSLYLQDSSGAIVIVPSITIGDCIPASESKSRERRRGTSTTIPGTAAWPSPACKSKYSGNRHYPLRCKLRPGVFGLPGWALRESNCVELCALLRSKMAILFWILGPRKMAASRRAGSVVCRASRSLS